MGQILVGANTSALYKIKCEADPFGVVTE